MPRSSCLNLALLRKLIVSSSGPAKAQRVGDRLVACAHCQESATKHIEELLKVVAEHETLVVNL